MVLFVPCFVLTLVLQACSPLVDERRQLQSIDLVYNVTTMLVGSARERPAVVYCT